MTALGRVRVENLFAFDEGRSSAAHQVEARVLQNAAQLQSMRRVLTRGSETVLMVDERKAFAMCSASSCEKKGYKAHHHGDAVLLAMSRLGGHNSGHMEKQRFLRHRKTSQ
jgi:hypothetical protein